MLTNIFTISIINIWIKICMLAALTTVKQGKTVMYIDSANSFSPERIIEMMHSSSSEMSSQVCTWEREGERVRGWEGERVRGWEGERVRGWEGEMGLQGVWEEELERGWR